MSTPATPSADNTTAIRTMILPDHCIVTATGKEVVKLLQGQCTGDFNRLANGESVLAAHCSPKGRMLSSFVAATLSDEVVGLRMHKSIADVAITALNKYAMFFRVKLAKADWVISCQELAHTMQAEQFTRCEEGIQLFHTGALVETWQPAAPPAAETDGAFWEYQQIIRGLAEVTAATTDNYLPQAFNYDLVNGINFKKGCYTGQEIIARVHYKGQSKQRLHCLSGAAPAVIGQALVDTDNKTRGEIVRTTFWQGRHWHLATTNAFTSDEPLHLENHAEPLTREALPYAIP